MNLKLPYKKYDVIQFVWWGFSDWQRFGVWTYPRKGRWKIFKGFTFGLFEIRLLYRFGKKTISQDNGKGEGNK